MGEVVMVIGASSGIGREIAISLSKDKKVIAVARREERLKELQRYGIITKVFDVTKFDEIDMFVKSISKEEDRINSLIYSAGVQNISPIRSLEISEARDLFDVNYFGALSFAKVYSNKLVCSKINPSIVFISSIAGIKPEKGILNYSASKAALNNLTKGLAKEVAPVRVNAVAPGFVETDMTEQFKTIYDKEFKDDIRRKCPLGLGSINDIVGLVAFLVSDKASYITGNIVTVDGGGIL